MKRQSFIALLSIACIITIVPSTVIAKVNSKTTTVVFPKGSTCGSFYGNVQGRNLVLGLLKGQLFFVNPDDPSAYRVTVRDPNGGIMRDEGGSMVNWYIPKSGRYRVTLEPFDKRNKMTNVVFCANNP